MLNNLHEFTQLVHMLANKFDKSTMEIASKFNTPTAKKYIELAKDMFATVMYQASYENIDHKIINLINNGADVDVVTPIFFNKRFQRLLYIVYKTDQKNIAKLLLDAGANPNFIEGSKEKTLNYINTVGGINPELQKLIKEAIEKW